MAVSDIIFDITSEMIRQLIGAKIPMAELMGRKETTEITNKLSLDEIRAQIAVAQELAIARRIETADEVEIEEFYDNSKEGYAGLKGTEEGISLGIGGNGRKITKRIYKFKGYNDKRIEAYEQARDKVFKIKTDELNKESNG